MPVKSLLGQLESQPLSANQRSNILVFAEPELPFRNVLVALDAIGANRDADAHMSVEFANLPTLVVQVGPQAIRVGDATVKTNELETALAEKAKQYEAAGTAPAKVLARIAADDNASYGDVALAIEASKASGFVWNRLEFGKLQHMSVALPQSEMQGRSITPPLIIELRVADDGTIDKVILNQINAIPLPDLNSRIRDMIGTSYPPPSGQEFNLAFVANQDFPWGEFRKVYANATEIYDADGKLRPFFNRTYASRVELRVR